MINEEKMSDLHQCTARKAFTLSKSAKNLDWREDEEGWNETDSSAI